MAIFDPVTDLSPTYFSGDAPPPDYATSMETVAPGIVPLIAQTQVQGETWTDTLKRSLPIIAATYQQKQILDVQMDRAKQGLPPLDASQYGVGVNVGLSPEVMKMVMLGLVGIGAVIFLSRKS